MVEMYVGVHFSLEARYVWSDETFIEGSVGDLSPEDWEAGHSFDWGLFGYERSWTASASPSSPTGSNPENRALRHFPWVS